MSEDKITLVRKHFVAEHVPEWERSTKYRHVWKHIPTGKWTYEDETMRLEEDYTVNTEEEAYQALRDYAAFSLDNGLERVGELLRNSKGILVMTSANRALGELAKNNGKLAIDILRADIDSIRSYSEELADLVINRPKVNIG